MKPTRQQTAQRHRRVIEMLPYLKHIRRRVTVIERADRVRRTLETLTKDRGRG